MCRASIIPDTLCSSALVTFRLTGADNLLPKIFDTLGLSVAKSVCRSATTKGETLFLDCVLIDVRVRMDIARADAAPCMDFVLM